MPFLASSSSPSTAIYLSIYLPTYLSTYLPTYLPISHLSVTPSCDDWANRAFCIGCVARTGHTTHHPGLHAGESQAKIARRRSVVEERRDLADEEKVNTAVSAIFMVSN